MIKVLIDARWIRSGQRGIGNFTSDLISAISLTKCDNLKYVIAANENTISNLKILYGSRFEYIKIPNLSEPILDFFYFSILNIIHRYNVIHFTGNSGFIFFKNKTRIVLTLHDVSFMKNFDIVPRPQRIKQLIGRKYRKTFVPLFIRNSDEIVTVSKFAKDDILTEFPNISNIDFVYHGFKENKNKSLYLISLNLFENKFLVISGNDPQKNLLSVVKAFSSLYKNLKHLAPAVVVIGLSKKQFLKHNPNIIIEPNIFFYGYLDNDNFPTKFYEGYSLTKEYSDKYGIIDEKGNYILKPKYDNIYGYCGEIFYYKIISDDILNEFFSKKYLSYVNGIDYITKLFYNNLVLVRNGLSLFYVDINGFEYIDK